MEFIINLLLVLIIISFGLVFAAVFSLFDWRDIDMSDKAYIITTEQQEREVLYGLEQKGFTWSMGDRLTKFTPSRMLHVEFPYILFAQETFVTWNRIDETRDLENYEIVYDGRK